MNLLEETVHTLNSNGLSFTDVKWVGSNDGTRSCDWKKFVELADVEYNNSYGSWEVPLNLVVVGENWWLERHEYDGSEWWEFKKMPTVHPETKPVLTVIPGRAWGLFPATIEDVHTKGAKYE